MKRRAFKILVAILAFIAPGQLSSSWADTNLSGRAALLYNRYDAEVAGKEVFSGSSLAQNYSLEYRATNLKYKGQPRYYAVSLGYDWVGFTTRTTILGQDANIRQTFDEFKYSGAVGYRPAELPFKFTAYINQTLPYSLNSSLDSNTLISDELIYDIANRGTNNASGFSFIYEPSHANNAFMRGLPKFIMDYREHSQKTTYGLSRIDNKTKELSVASLNQGDNWLIFRAREYENYLVSFDRFSQQEIQIGNVDYKGQRNWALLTNWISLSMDGRMTSTRSPITDSEEYDVNFMAIARRTLWSARTFLNYNRLTVSDSLTESVSVPVYVNGIYGKDSDWYVRVGTTRGRQKDLTAKVFDTSHTNTIAAGGTTFKNSSFTLSPSIRLAASKYYDGTDLYSIAAEVESLSTSRFSNKLNLAGKLSWQAQDDGFNRSWTSFLDLNGAYAPHNNLSYRLQERIEVGSGAGYLANYRSRYDSYTAAPAGTNTGTYLRNYLLASAQWMPSAQFSTSLEGSYEHITATDLPTTTGLIAAYWASYQNKATTFRIDSRYSALQAGYNPATYSWLNSATVSYRPDRYNDGFLRFRQEIRRESNAEVNQLELLQRYNYNFFSRGGVVRNIATISEEYSYVSADTYGIRANTDGTYSASHYLMISGRYNPTARTSLYGSVKYLKSAGFSATTYYNAGLTADLRFFNASLDYLYAKRDSDNRLEKRLMTSVSRTF